MKPKIIDIEQGSPSWLSLRKNKITATDSAPVLGISPFKTAYGLWEEKLGLREPQKPNERMDEGLRLEEKARAFYNLHEHSNFEPIVLQSEENPWQIASLDGMDILGRILEIKCGVSSHEMAKRKEIPQYYFAQLQKQMWVADTDYAIYMSYRSDLDWIHWEVYRDDKFIKEMNEKEKIFYECLMNLTPPELTDKDYVMREDFQWSIHVEEYKNAKAQRERFENEEKKYKDLLIELSGGKSTKGCGVSVSKIFRKGNIDYNSIPEIKSIDLEKYRKQPTTYMSIRND